MILEYLILPKAIGSSEGKERFLLTKHWLMYNSLCTTQDSDEAISDCCNKDRKSWRTTITEFRKQICHIQKNNHLLFILPFEIVFMAITILIRFF